jgi:hypothetical protein
VPSFLSAIARVADQLTALLPRSGLDFYRAAVAAIDLAEPDTVPPAVPCEVVFVERLGERDVIVLVIGLDLPQPRGGYPLRLRDGTVARLSQPPWRLGFSY